MPLQRHQAHNDEASSANVGVGQIEAVKSLQEQASVADKAARDSQVFDVEVSGDNKFSNVTSTMFAQRHT